MKHKHSPNFHTNLEEADKAKNNRATTFFWTVVLVVTLMLGFSLTGCEPPPPAYQSKEKVLNTKYELEFLFEKDSCKMYRFYDGDRYIYWANCNGKTEYEYSVGTPKARSSHKQQTIITK